MGPGVAAPAPEAPLPTRAIGEHDWRAGPLRLQILAAPSSAARGEWSAELQPGLFRAYVGLAPGA